MTIGSGVRAFVGVTFRGIAWQLSAEHRLCQGEWAKKLSRSCGARRCLSSSRAKITTVSRPAGHHDLREIGVRLFEGPSGHGAAVPTIGLTAPVGQRGRGVAELEIRPYTRWIIDLIPWSYGACHPSFPCLPSLGQVVTVPGNAGAWDPATELFCWGSGSGHGYGRSGHTSSGDASVETGLAAGAWGERAPGSERHDAAVRPRAEE